MLVKISDDCWVHRDCIHRIERHHATDNDKPKCWVDVLTQDGKSFQSEICAPDEALKIVHGLVGPFADQR